MTPRLHLLPWDKPLLPQAVAWLTAEWTGTGPLDLADRLVIVPTRQAGRRLREALAATAATRHQAVFPPRVVSPETLATLGAPARGVASRLTAQLAWITVLRSIELDDFPAVFPVEPPVRDFGWARRLATQLLALQATLAENGLRMADVGDRAGDDFPESVRWRQLAVLESRYDHTLAASGLCDAQAAKIAWSAAPVLPEGIRQIVVLFVPDPLPLALSILAQHARQVPVTVVVGGPADRSAGELFDEWGRPQPPYWSQQPPLGAGFERQVRLYADPAAQATQVLAVARRYATPDALLAVGVADPEVLAPLENELGRAGIAVFNPEGRPRRRDGFYALLNLLAEFAGDDGFAPAAALLRCADVLDWLGRRGGARFSPARMLAELDTLQSDHLPPTLTAARVVAGRFPLLAEALEALTELRGRLTRGPFPDNALAALRMLFQGRSIEREAPLVESAEAWQEVVAECRHAWAAFPGLSLTESWELALALLGDSMRFEEKAAGALELQGWLELLWEDAPHLIVAGLNEGAVPKAIIGDVFLPEALRRRLALKTNETRLVCDIYLLAALAAMRAAHGRLELLVGKTSAAGDPLRPSRLLLLCADEELPHRISVLFRRVETAQASLPWTRAWALSPRRVPPPATISVTALRTYLACPFRFYLKHLLRMDALDPLKAELDARDFGTLLHDALEVIGLDDGLRRCADEAVLREALLTRFEQKVRARYGDELTLPLVVQFESARQRLRKAAEIQALEAAAGWMVEKVETSFECVLGGLTVRGKIDRIDRHADGRVRVLDYKTSDKPVNPVDAHLDSISPSQPAPPEWATVTVNGKARRWIDLQLPLYRLALSKEFGVAVECGYFNLPKAAGEVAVSRWEDFSPELQAAAEHCAAEVARRVAAGEFWPPAELPERRDGDWATLLHRGAAASVAADWPTGGGA